MAAIADMSPGGRGRGEPGARHRRLHRREDERPRDGHRQHRDESRSYYLLGYVAREHPARRALPARSRSRCAGRASSCGPGGATTPPSTRRRRTRSRPRSRRTRRSSSASTRRRRIDQIPLRMTSYVLDDLGMGHSRVLLAADADISKVDFEESAGKLLGALDTLAVAARRENSEVFRNDQKVDLQRKPGPVASPSWYTIVREFELPPGTYQSKLVVRDTRTRRLGTVSLEFEVPPPGQLRLSSPILTDNVQVAARRDAERGAPRPAHVQREEAVLLPLRRVRRHHRPGHAHAARPRPARPAARRRLRGERVRRERDRADLARRRLAADADPGRRAARPATTSSS